jgi:hypothetical protein
MANSARSPSRRAQTPLCFKPGGNRLDPVLARLREVMARIDNWVDHGEGAASRGGSSPPGDGRSQAQADETKVQ